MELGDGRMGRMSGRRGVPLTGLLVMLVIFSLTSGIAVSGDHDYISGVVGVEQKIIRARGKDGTVWVFWVERKPRWKPGRIPEVGEKVKIRYVKDKLYRNALLELTILGK